MILILRQLTLIWSHTNLDHDTVGEGQDIHYITSASAILMKPQLSCSARVSYLNKTTGNLSIVYLSDIVINVEKYAEG